MKKSRAFTLIELLIVMSVIAIIISIALPSFKGMQNQARIIKAQGDLRSIKVAIESYYSNNNNQYPAVANYQTTLQSATPQILTTTLSDPFSTGASSTYAYALSNTTGSNSSYYVIYSVGLQGTGSASVNNTTGVVSATGNSIWDGNGH